MIFWENKNILKNLYIQCVKPVCENYSLTMMEFTIIMFVANNPRFDTATDITEILQLTKSHVSASLKSLEEKQLISRFTQPGNKKVVHIKLQSETRQIVTEGRAAQEQCGKILLSGFSTEDMELLQQKLERIYQNARDHMKLSD